MMKLRPEVEEALGNTMELLGEIGEGGEFRQRCDRLLLIALVELGVRLGVEAASNELSGVPIVSYSGYGGEDARGTLDEAFHAIRALVPADILQAQPGAEGER